MSSRVLATDASGLNERRPCFFCRRRREPSHRVLRRLSSHGATAFSGGAVGALRALNLWVVLNPGTRSMITI